MTEVEFEQVVSIKTSLEEIARQLKIANTMKAIDLMTRGVSLDKCCDIIRQSEGCVGTNEKKTQEVIDPLEKAFREEMDFLRGINDDKE